MRFLTIFAMITVTLLLLYSTTGLPILFDHESPASTHVSPRYIEKSYEETGSANFVTAVLADYRAYDTLGEAAVIFTAGIASALVLKSYSKKKSKRKDDDDDREDDDREDGDHDNGANEEPDKEVSGG